MSHAYDDDPLANPGPPKRGQCVLFRNVWFKPSDFPVEEITGELFASGVNQAVLEEICARSKAKALQLKGMTAADLSPLGELGDLERLDITWAHKFSDVTPLRRLKALTHLTLSDTKRWHDLSQLEGLNVVKLDISGGIWNANRYESLAALAKLERLEKLSMTNVKVENGGLKPLAGCARLKQLNVAYTFPTEDYAYLSVKMPDTKCDAFAPYLRVKHVGEKDVMVVGFRKPFLNAAKDAARLEKYVAQFEQMQARFREA